mmetsp:Transcript_39658/g.63629  ORF Transcript_39658/g.63629 Transcript_39658/m.63629 type:complete len:378 (+) Transcript_39658:49-1182(+)
MDVSALGMALKRVKLKKNKEVNDRSAPMMKAGLEKKDLDQYYKDVQDTYVESWEPLLTAKGLTFRTAYVPMQKKEAEAMVKAYEAHEKLSEEEKKGKHYAKFYAMLLKDPVFSKMQETLQKQIDECLNLFKCDKVFVKGSSRSAKDAVIDLQNMTADFESRCQNVKKQKGEGGKCDLNSGVVSLLGAGKDAMSGTSAQYFLQLFVRSERIYQDMRLALQMKDFKSGWAIREWIDVDIGMEFRGFVYRRKFCALCQYDYLVKVEHLQDSKTRQDIISTIEKFYANSVAPALHREESPFQNYIADFAIDTTGKCWIIELNPYQESTDGAMFSWATEKQLLSTEPLNFRYQSVPQNATVALGKKWRKLLNSTLKRINAEA